jgi:hypothetical protein
MTESARTSADVRISSHSRLLTARPRSSFLDRPGDICSAAFLAWFSAFMVTHIYFAWPHIMEALQGRSGGAM